MNDMTGTLSPAEAALAPLASLDINFSIGTADVSATVEVYGRIHSNSGSWEHGDNGRWIEVDRVDMNGVDVTDLMDGWDGFRTAINDYCFKECR